MRLNYNNKESVLRESVIISHLMQIRKMMFFFESGRASAVATTQPITAIKLQI